MHLLKFCVYFIGLTDLCVLLSVQYAAEPGKKCVEFS